MFIAAVFVLLKLKYFCNKYFLRFVFQEINQDSSRRSQ